MSGAAFGPVLSADWRDDAPVWGVARRVDGRVYRFVLLALDGGSLDWRLYGLVSISEEEFAEGREIWKHQWGDEERPAGPDLSERIEQIARAPLGWIAAVVLTSGLGSRQALVADLGPDGSADYDLPHPPSSIQEWLEAGAGRVLPRAEFERWVTRYFGPVTLPDLDGDETDL
jgi:hypothetical protein